MMPYASKLLRSRYMSHKEKRAAAVMYLATGGPPSSPPTDLLLRASKIMIAMAAPEQKIVTEKAKLQREIKLIFV